jgi:chromate transporter
LSEGSRTRRTQPTELPRVGLRDLFLAFFEITTSGFGGAQPSARRTLLERRGWLTDREFAELLGFCQILPGGNIINVSIAIGTRMCGPRGALTAFAGLMLPPFFLFVGMGILYGYGARVEAIQTALRGVASVAVGMLMVTGVRLVLSYRREPWALLLAAVGFTAVGLLRLPLLQVLVVLAPLSVAFAWWRTR